MKDYFPTLMYGFMSDVPISHLRFPPELFYRILDKDMVRLDPHYYINQAINDIYSMKTKHYEECKEYIEYYRVLEDLGTIDARNRYRYVIHPTG